MTPKAKKNKFTVLFSGLMVLVILLSTIAVSVGKAQDDFPPQLQPELSADGLTLYNAVPPLVIVDDPDPAMQGLKFPVEAELAASMADQDAANATFSITYVPSGGTDPWGAKCIAWPEAAKTAFNKAAEIWSNTVQSPVPITIRACWNDFPDGSTTLGYSGGQISYRNFTGAPKTNTWYQSSLANSLRGIDLGPGDFDMLIAYNSDYSWYYGTDGNTPTGQHDLVTVAAHEIAHGLNFSGTANYSGGSGSWGDSGSPNIYDTFMEDSTGKKVTSFTSPSTALGYLYTSNNLWFNGSFANAANGGARVKMYAPSTWKGGSSYSHLDYDTFKEDTDNRMMVYAVSSGTSQHNPGNVTKGILRDMGWKPVSITGPTYLIYLPMVARDLAESPITFTPKAGRWDSSTQFFYVTPDGTKVDDVSTRLKIDECDGNIYTVTHLSMVPIVNNEFSFSGTYSGSGTFTSTTSGSITTKFTNFLISGCGYIDGGPYTHTVTWTNSDQPSSVGGEVINLVVNLENPDKFLPGTFDLAVFTGR